MRKKLFALILYSLTPSDINLDTILMLKVILANVFLSQKSWSVGTILQFIFSMEKYKICYIMPQREIEIRTIAIFLRQILSRSLFSHLLRTERGSCSYFDLPLELRQYTNDSTQLRIIPTLNLPLFFTTYTVREKAHQFQNWNYF